MNDIQAAVSVLHQGGVIAYPTESCFGIGCDPNNATAIERVISIKARSASKGLIIIAATIEQAMEYIDLEQSKFKDDILASWPGPNTWLLPAKAYVQPLLKGDFPLLAVRVTKHPVANELCRQFGGAIVSTSANLAGEDALKTTAEVQRVFSDKVDEIVDDVVGDDAKPSTIRDGLSGEILRR